MWLLYATAASAMWGLSYALHEQIYRHLSIYTTIALHTLVISIIFFVMGWYKDALRADFTVLGTSTRVLILFVSSILVFAAAEFFIAMSIVAKNATLAGLIEISYPLFIALFAYILFKETALNGGIILGGMVIFIGVGIVFWFSR